MKKPILLVYLLIFILPLTACWNYREVDRMSIVIGLAIDKTGEGNYLMTFEVVGLEKTGSEQKMKSILIESEGETLMDAIRNTISKNPNKLYFGHALIVILSQEVARDGALKVIDFFLRDAEPRLNVNLLVSKDDTAGEILKAKARTSGLLSIEINSMLDNQKSLSKALMVPAYKFANSLSGEGVSGIMTSLCTEVNNEEKIIKLCGTAIFKKDILQGFIDKEETYALSFIMDEVKGGIIVANVSTGINEEKISLEIIKSKTKIKPIYKDDKLSINISINTSVALIEHGAIEKNYSDEKGRAELKRIAEEQLKNKIASMIKNTQKEFGSDIFGFGNLFYKELPKVWKEKGENWEELFKDLAVTVEPKITIKHTSLLSKPIQMGE